MQPIDWSAVAALIETAVAVGTLYLVYLMSTFQRHQIQAETVAAQAEATSSLTRAEQAEVEIWKVTLQGKVSDLRADLATLKLERNEERAKAFEREKELRDEVETLRAKVKDLEAEVDKLRKENAQLKEENKQLKARIADLEKRPAGAKEEGEKPKETEDK